MSTPDAKAEIDRIDAEIRDARTRLSALKDRIATVSAETLAREGTALAKAAETLERRIANLSERRIAVMAGDLPKQASSAPPPRPQRPVAPAAYDLRAEAIERHLDADDVGGHDAIATYRQKVEAMRLDEVKLRRPPSLRLLLLTNAISNARLKEAILVRDERIAELERRLEAIEAGGIAYRGVWQRSQPYTKGAAVTHQGSLWIALSAAPEGVEPGTAEGAKHWQLGAKSGRPEPTIRRTSA